MQGGALFLLVFERLQTLYPGAYDRGDTSMYEGAEQITTLVQLSARTHPGAAVIDSFLGGGDPSPTQPSSLVGVRLDSSPVPQKSWIDGGSAYGGQNKIDLSILAGVEHFFAGRAVVGGVGATENPTPPSPPTHRGEPLAKIFSPPHTQCLCS